MKSRNVCAGTGKSLLLKHILRALPPATTYVTASTGLAASVLGGTTLNAFAGPPTQSQTTLYARNCHTVPISLIWSASHKSL